MLPQPGNRILNHAADGRGRKQPVIGQQEQEGAHHQQPTAYRAQQHGDAHAGVLIFAQQPLALPPRRWEADDILFGAGWLLFAHTFLLLIVSRFGG